MNYQTFTDTIRANFDNFNSKLSISINVKNYDDINISKVENYYCNGNSLTFQPHIYNYKFAYWRVVKSIEIEISGQADDYAQVIVNNSITVHPNLQDTLGIKDGIYIWGKTQSSDYVKEKHPFTMTNENLNIQFGTVNTLPTVCYLKASLKIRLFFQFTNSISPSVNSLGTLNKTLKVVLKHVFSKSVANVNTEPVNCGLGCYWEYDVISIKIDLPDEVSNYSKVDSFFKLYGMADNGFKFYLNNSLLKTVESICPSMCHIQSNWSPSNYNFSFPVTSKNNTLLIKAYSDQMIYWAKIYSASVSIETTSKQFTDTVKTSVSTFSANLNNKIQLVNIYTIKGNNVAECHVFELVEIWKLLYTLNISVKSKDVEKAYITATLTAEGDDEFIFKLNNSYNMSLPSNAGSCKTCSACGNYTNFYKNSTKTFDVTQYLQDTNSIYVYFHNFTGGYSYKISNLEFTIKTYSKLQFTSTVKLSSNSSYATINKDIPVGYFFTNLGDDNSDALRGTWNADRTVKTVTSSTADWSDYLISGADIVFLNSDIHDGLTCLKFSDGRNVNIPQNFEVTIDKMIPFYEYHQGNDDPSFPTHRKDGYYFYLTISPIWFTSFSNANILLSNRNNMNGSYNFTFKFNYNNKDYSFKKTLVISF